MSKTKIEWCRAPGRVGRVWNPTVGCSKVSPGCENCYAESLATRFKLTSKPWTAPHAAENVKLRPEKLMDPWHWSKPSLVFVNSMSDLFHERVPFEFIDAVFAVMAASPQHIFIVLTKRPARMRGYLSDPRRHGVIVAAGVKLNPNSPPRYCYHVSHSSLRLASWPLPNVWLGVSAEDQRRWNERVPDLIATPAAIKVVSVEPLLGPIDPRVIHETNVDGARWVVLRGNISWLIVGGESGVGARPCNLVWIRSFVGQAKAHGVPIFVKQLGSRPVGEWLHGQPPEYRLDHADGRPGHNVLARHKNGVWRLNDRKGANPEEWPEDLRVREWPAALGVSSAAGFC